MLETEMGGVQIYTTALRCVENEDLKKEWEEYLEQTKNHVTIVQGCIQKLTGPGRRNAGRLVVRHIGESLVKPWNWLCRKENRVRSWLRPNALCWLKRRTT